MDLQKVVTHVANDLNPVAVFQRCLQCWAYINRAIDGTITIVNGFIQEVIYKTVGVLDALGKDYDLLVNVGTVLLDCGIVKMVSEFPRLHQRGVVFLKYGMAYWVLVS